MIDKVRQMEENSKVKYVRELYQGVNWYIQGFKARINVVRYEEGDLVADSTNVLNTRKDYFNKLLNVDQDRIVEDQEFKIHSAEPLVEVSTITEVYAAIPKLKNYNSPGIDAIAAELIKNGGSMLMEKITS